MPVKVLHLVRGNRIFQPSQAMGHATRFATTCILDSSLERLPQLHIVADYSTRWLINEKITSSFMYNFIHHDEQYLRALLIIRLWRQVDLLDTRLSVVLTRGGGLNLSHTFATSLAATIWPRFGWFGISTFLSNFLGGRALLASTYPSWDRGHFLGILRLHVFLRAVLSNGGLGSWSLGSAFTLFSFSEIDFSRGSWSRFVSIPCIFRIRIVRAKMAISNIIGLRSTTLRLQTLWSQGVGTCLVWAWCRQA